MGNEGIKFTKGPWTLKTVPTQIGTCHMIGPFPSRGAREQTNAYVYADGIGVRDYGHSAVGDELLANAHLIAAAPDLYAALERATDLLLQYGEMVDEPRSRPAYRHVDVCREAMAKAVGKTWPTFPPAAKVGGGE